MKKLAYIFALAMIPNFVYADAPPEKAFLAPVKKVAATHVKKVAKVVPTPTEPSKVVAPTEKVAAPAPAATPAPAAPK